MNPVWSLLESALDTLLPRRCCACDAILRASLAFCPLCSTSLLACSDGGGMVRSGRDRPPKPWPFASVWAPYFYGGQLAVASRASWRRDLISALRRLVDEVEHLGVDIRFNVFAESGEVEAENPDVVVVATGGLPDTAVCAGAELVCSVTDVLMKMAKRNGLTGLSMGMRADFDSAIALGATHVRVGSAIFGERAPGGV